MKKSYLIYFFLPLLLTSGCFDTRENSQEPQKPAEASSRAIIVDGRPLGAAGSWNDLTDIPADLADGDDVDDDNALPTILSPDAGNTVTVTRTGADIFAVELSSPATITINTTGWNTNEVDAFLLELKSGTNGVIFSPDTIFDVGRASSTNLFISTSGTTELLFQLAWKELKWYVIQLTP